MEDVTAAKACLDAARAATSEAQEAFNLAVVQAVRAGANQSELARQVGLTRQAISLIVSRHEPSDADLDARIVEIQDKWNKLVTFYSDQWNLRDTGKLRKGQCDSDTGWQNDRNKASGAKKARRNPLNVKSQRFAFAETKLLALMHEQRDQVPVFATALRELTRLDQLLQERSRRNDLRF